MYRPTHINLCNVTFNIHLGSITISHPDLFSKNNTNGIFVAQKLTNINIRQLFSIGFQKLRLISWQAEKLSVPQVLCFMQLAVSLYDTLLSVPKSSFISIWIRYYAMNNFMYQSPSWQSTNHSVDEEIHCP
jgi:hypothetical protein